MGSTRRSPLSPTSMSRFPLSPTSTRSPLLHTPSLPLPTATLDMLPTLLLLLPTLDLLATATLDLLTTKFPISTFGSLQGPRPCLVSTSSEGCSNDQDPLSDAETTSDNEIFKVTT